MKTFSKSRQGRMNNDGAKHPALWNDVSKKFIRPYGTLMYFLTFFPKNKFLGYCQMSLRDKIKI